MAAVLLIPVGLIGQPSPVTAVPSRGGRSETEALRKAAGSKADDRREAITDLGDVGSRRSVKVLTDTLKNDQDPDLRARSAWSLGRIGDSAAVPVLIDSLTADPRSDVRANAARSLAAFPTTEASAALVRSLQDAAPEVKVAAIFSIAKHADPQSVPHLVPLLNHSDPQVVERACWALGEMRQPSSIPPLAEKLTSGATPGIRSVSAFALGRIRVRDEATAKKLLATALSPREDSMVRVAAIKAVGMIASAADANSLLPALRDPDSAVRKFAVFSLVQTGYREADAALEELLKDQDRVMRRAVMTAMGLSPQRFQPAILKSALDDTQDLEVRLLALTSLADIPVQLAGSAPELIKVLDRAQPPEIQIAVVQVLGQIASPAVRTSLGLLGDRENLDPQTRELIRNLLAGR